MGILKIRTLSWWTSLGRAVVENNRSFRITCIPCKGSGSCWTAADIFRMLTPQGLSAFCQHLGSHRATLCTWDAPQKDTNQEFWGPRLTEVDLWSKVNQINAFLWNLTPAQSSSQTLSYPLEFNHPGGGQTVPAVSCSRNPCCPWFQASGRPLFPVSLSTLVSTLPINSRAANIFFSVYLQASVSPSQFPNCWLQQKEPDWNTRSSEPCRRYLQRPGWGLEGRIELHTCIILNVKNNC